MASVATAYENRTQEVYEELYIEELKKFHDIREKYTGFWSFLYIRLDQDDLLDLRLSLNEISHVVNESVKQISPNSRDGLVKKLNQLQTNILFFLSEFSNTGVIRKSGSVFLLEARA